MIEFREVGKRFEAPPGPWGRGGAVHALREVTLEVPRGGVTAVVGPNGAGKSTLFALALGFLHPAEGAVRVDGVEPRRYVRRNGAAYLPERFRLPGEWPVRGGLRALARLEGLGGREAAARADELLERLELAPHAGKRVSALSRGLLQRLGLAQALLVDRALVVLDEPTEGLDPLWRIRFRSLVDGLRSEGRTVLLASHDLSEVERLAERAVLLDGGRVKEVLDVVPAPEARAVYRLELAAESPLVAEAFPGAALVPGAANPTYAVSVAGPTELSGRLAALIAAGGVVVSVRPTAEPLEERVRKALGGEAGA